MEQRLGITRWLRQTFEHQIAGRLESEGMDEVAGHRTIECIVSILCIDDLCHTLECFTHLRLADHAVQQPVGNVLTGDTQSRTVFHQADIMNVRHLGAADTLFDPAHHIAEDALRIVIQFLLNFGCRPVWLCDDRNHQQLITQTLNFACCIGFFKLLLNLGDIHLVIVQRMQGRGGRRRHPGGIGAGFRMADFLFQHR